MSPQGYIERVVDQYIRMYGSKPKTVVTSPIEKNDHSELDDSAFLDAEGIQQYKSLVGSLQWAVSLGRFDITTGMMTLSGFLAVPRQGHLDRAKRMVGYLAQMKFAKIRFRVAEPDYSAIPDYD